MEIQHQRGSGPRPVASLPGGLGPGPEPGLPRPSMHGYELVAMRLLAMPLIGACNE